VAGFTKLLTYIAKHHKDEQKPELVFPKRELVPYLLWLIKVKTKRET